MTNSHDLATALAEAARTISTPRALGATLQSIAETAAHSLPGVDHAGISLVHRKGKIETLAATDDLVWKLDQLQYELAEGPCVSSIYEDPVVKVNDVRHEQRWPRFVPRAAQMGLRSQLALRLYSNEETLGGLNLYSTSTDVLDEDVEHMAELFAAHAAIALGSAKREEDLNAALQTRKIIGQALGILMERYNLEEDVAFAFLLRTSSTTNVKLREVARQLVDDRNEQSRAAEDS